MKTEEIKISYDTRPEDFIDMITGVLDTLGVKYEESGEETITIKYWVNHKNQN